MECGTIALGADVYASETDRLLVYHTCKSRACPSCGYRATAWWQDELEALLPDVFYVNINFTMSSFFWPIFQQNRHLLNGLPAIGASTIKRWAENRYGVSVILISVPRPLGVERGSAGEHRSLFSRRLYTQFSRVHFGDHSQHAEQQALD